MRHSNTDKEVKTHETREINENSKEKLKNEQTVKILEKDIDQQVIEQHTQIMSLGVESKTHNEQEQQVKYQEEKENSKTRKDIQRRNEASPEQSIMPPRNDIMNIEQEKQTNIPVDVPSPFKKSLFWPCTSKTEIRKRKREKIPAVATSSDWRLYYEKKEEKKRAKLVEVEERKKEREEKAKRNLELKKQKAQKREKKNTSSKTDDYMESEEEEGSDDSSISFSIELLQVGSHVIVYYSYNKHYYPGIVQKIDGDEFYVDVMTESGNGWKWPSPKDTIWYKKDDIIECTRKPEEINKRGVYNVPEMKKYLPLK